MTQPASLLPVDPSPRPKMPKNANGNAGDFRLMIERPSKGEATHTLKGPGRMPRSEPERAADDRIDLRVHSEPKLAAIDEQAPTAINQADVEQDEPVDEEQDGSREDGLRESDEQGAAIPQSLQAIEELRKLLGAAKANDDTGQQESERDEAEPASAAEDSRDDTRAARGILAGTPDAIPAPAERAARAATPLDKVAVTRAAEDAGPPLRNTSSPAVDDAPATATAVRATGRDQASSGDAGKENGRGRQDGKPMPGVTVVADAPASPQPAPQPATRAVVATLGADPAWAAYFRAKPEPAAHPPQSLTVQLRPAELGVVTAHLRFAGERVAVELRAETSEAHRQLSGDTDMIARSLRAAGIEVDQVTVQPAPQAQDSGRGALSGRDEGGTAGGGAFASPDNSGERGGRQSGSGAQGFQTGRGGDETRTGAGGADRDGRYI